MPTHILYAEDDESARFLVKDLLELEGFEVSTAEDGQEAIQMISKNTYDLVLLDIRMPRKNGLDVLKYMKDNNKRPRVIMVSAVEDVSIAIEAVKLGANDYLRKPYAIEDLVSCINRVLAR